MGFLVYKKVLQLNYMNKISPGHFKAYTIWLFIILGITVYFETKNLTKVFDLFLLIFGMFIGDQATHLAQKDHSAIPPTLIERHLQKHPYPHIIAGLIMAVIGLKLLLS